MIYGLAVWIALTLFVMGLFAYRFFLARNEDDMVHLADSEVKLISQQTALAARLDRVDAWRRRLTFVDLLFGLALGGTFIYNTMKSTGLL